MSNERPPHVPLNEGWTTNHLDLGCEIIKKSLTTSHLQNALAPETPPEPPSLPPPLPPSSPDGSDD